MPQNYHWYSDIDIRQAITDGSFSFYANCPFPVKEIRINFSYYIISDLPPYVLISSSMLQNNTVGVINNFTTVDNNGACVSVDNFKTSNQFSYIYSSPAIIQSLFRFEVRDVVNPTYDAVSYAKIHLEFISDDNKNPNE